MQQRITFSSGIGLRGPHMQDLLDNDIKTGFLEAHSENYFGGGEAREQLKQLAKRYPITLHGVGLSLGRADGLDKDHLNQLKSLVDEIDPVFVSEHLTWSGYSHTHVADLLPLPFTNEALDVFCDHVKEFQDLLGRNILVENPSNYLAFKNLEYKETEFLNLVAERTECGLLIDINNIEVSSHNLGYDAEEYIREVHPSFVRQIHLAGYQENELDDGTTIFLDTHGHPVYENVWQLYALAIEKWGDIPTLMEWDTDIPAIETVLQEAYKADEIKQSILNVHKDSVHA